MQFGFTLLSNQTQDQSGKSSSCIACLAVSQPRGCSPPNITVSLVFFNLHQIAFVARQSFLYRCAKELNKAMHILNGNTVAKGPTWRRRNRLSPSTHFLFGTYNVGGLQDSTKRIRLAELQADVLGLTETHLQSHLEHSESMLFPEYSCFWSRNPDDRHFRGIGILVRKASFWASSLIQWSPDSSCYKFYEDNRLLAIQLWFGNGAMSMLVYTCYGPSGARWESDKRAYFHAMYKAIEEDRLQRGALPAVLLGDFNLQISDSHVLAQALQQKVWCDTRDHSSLEVQNTPTCHKGKGSFIDHIWVSPNLYDLCNSFAITKHHEFKDHSLLTIKIGIPRSEQNIKSLRSVRKLPDALPLPSRDDSKIPSAISPKFQCAINSQDVDAAFKYWSQEFERILFIIAGKLPASQTDSVAAKRGQIVFHDQRKFPKTVQGHASTLKARKLWKAHCQLVEILIATSGTRRDRTIANVAKVAQWLPQHQSNDFITSINCSNFQYALHLIKSALDANVKEDKQQRILHWKQKIRSDTKHSFQYLNPRPPAHQSRCQK